MKIALNRSVRRVALLAIAALAFSLSAATSARAEKEVMTPMHVAKLRSVGSPKISPDGKHVAYLLYVPREPYKEESGRSYSELHVTDLDGNSRAYITGKVNVGSIAWTPDGKGISFLAKRGDDKHTALYVIPIDGGEARKVLEHETSISSYTWEPTGNRVAFIAKEKQDKDLKKLKDKGFNQEIYEEDFVPTRAWVAEVGDGDDKAEPRMLDLPGTPSDLAWNPVKSWLAMALSPTPYIDDHYMNRKLHVFDADDGSIVSSFKNPGKLGAAEWSPDGKLLAFLNAADRNDPSEGRLTIADPSTGELKDILPNYAGHVASFEWQDPNTLLYFGDKRVHTELGKITSAGAVQVHVPTSARLVLSSLSATPNAPTAAFTSSSAEHPSELFVMSHGDKGPRRLTNSNPWLEDVRLAKQEVITWTARDGLEIDGILIRPLDEEPGKRYPLIMDVHGGPEAHEQDGWNTNYGGPGQVAAARGFAVLIPNYRGSTGRGVEFSKMGQADYGGKEFDDLIDAKRHLVKTGLVDPDRVGITGGSYGGFATAWCSTYHTKEFAAGVMFVGISDHVSKAATTDIPQEMYHVHARKRLWDDWDFFRERSPIYYIEQARTPLLILHGKEDPRVHPSQSLELYRNLKLLGNTPVRLVWYPGEGHGNRKSAARLDYNLRMIRWFEHFLKDGGTSAPEYEIDYGFGDDEKKDDEDADDNDD